MSGRNILIGLFYGLFVIIGSGIAMKIVDCIEIAQEARKRPPSCPDCRPALTYAGDCE